MADPTLYPDLNAVLDELALAGAEHLDPLYVAGYDRKSGFGPNDETDELQLLAGCSSP